MKKKFLSAVSISLAVMTVVGCTTTTSTTPGTATSPAVTVTTKSLDPGTVATIQGALSAGITDTAAIVALINSSKATNK